MKRRISLLLVVLLLIMAMPLSAFAAKADYVSLGDSIAVSPSYYDAVATYLQNSKKHYSSTNLAQDGRTSETILEDLTEANIKDAKVITLSIGGNNLLGPILDAIYTHCGISPAFSREVKLAMLIGFINANPDAWKLIQSQLLNSAELQLALKKGVNDFIEDWPLIMREIKRLAPKARVYVLTMYNPVIKDPNLGKLFTTLILPINSLIRFTPLWYRNVRVVDTSLLFALKPSSISFNLAAPISPKSLDSHPTEVGHKIIANTIILREMFVR